MLQQNDNGLATENLANTRQGKSDEGGLKGKKKGEARKKLKAE
jgi:hypothetical protein